MRAGLSASAASSASSRSVASFSAGWRSMRVPSASARATVSGEAESKSPTATVDLETERERVFEPAVGGDHQRTPSGTASSIARGSGGAPPDDHHHQLLRHAFLRWHYPDQVLRVGGALAALSARLPRAPRYVLMMLALVLPDARGVAQLLTVMVTFWLVLVMVAVTMRFLLLPLARVAVNVAVVVDAPVGDRKCSGSAGRHGALATRAGSRLREIDRDVGPSRVEDGILELVDEG